MGVGVCVVVPARIECGVSKSRDTAKEIQLVGSLKQVRRRGRRGRRGTTDQSDSDSESDSSG